MKNLIQSALLLTSVAFATTAFAVNPDEVFTSKWDQAANELMQDQKVVNESAEQLFNDMAVRSKQELVDILLSDTGVGMNLFSDSGVEIGITADGYANISSNFKRKFENAKREDIRNYVLVNNEKVINRKAARIMYKTTKFSIKSVVGLKYMDYQGDKIGLNGEYLQLWDSFNSQTGVANPPNAQQTWRLYRLPSGKYQIVNFATAQNGNISQGNIEGTCIDTNKSFQGQHNRPLQMWTCSNGKQEQQQTYTIQHMGSNKYQIVNTVGLCLGFLGNNPTNSMRVVQRPCTGDNRTQWYIDTW